jgi:hypothetical protein
MTKRNPTPVDAAVNEARERMPQMAPGDVIQIPVDGGRYSRHVAANRVRMAALKLWGKGGYHVIMFGLKGEIAVTRMQEPAG